MRMKSEEIDRLAERVLADLTAAGLIQLKKERGLALGSIREAVAEDIRAEETLERDAAAMLEKTLQSMRGTPDIDRHRMLRMIKEKLAKERKIVL